MVVVALAATPGSGAAVAAVAARIGVGHRIVSWHHHVRPVAGRRAGAVIAADVAVLGELGETAAEAGVPVVCAVRSVEDLDRASRWGVKASFTTDASLAEQFPGYLGRDLVYLPAAGLDLSVLPVVPLLTRARLRELHGLPSRLVLAVDRAALPAERTTSLALASAAVVEDDLVPLALALGTPSVVTEAAAERFDLRRGQVALVARRPDEADRMAAALARDEERSAALAGRARSFAERHLDTAPAVSRLRRALGLEAEPALVDLRLDELGTPPGSRLRRRADEALHLFTLEMTP